MQAFWVLFLSALATGAAPTPDAGSGPAVASSSGSAEAHITECSGWKVARVRVKGSIAAALVGAIGEEGSQVAARYARIFMWDLDLRRDVVPGDEMVAVWRKDAAGEIEIGAARYSSQKKGTTFRAYRFRALEDAYASYWDDSGLELPHRLNEGPLRRYEQITALLRDRPTHAGMDFKTPVGTPVHAPRAGVVTRANWRTKGNGRCLEVRYDDGVLAKFLHLSALKVAPGARVSRGQVIAATGNTGRSTAPHLHYQLNRDRLVLDPLEYHGTSRRRLGGQSLGGLKRAVAALTGACGSGTTIP
jgi:murein DD-endopeptidase